MCRQPKLTQFRCLQCQPGAVAQRLIMNLKSDKALGYFAVLLACGLRVELDGDSIGSAAQMLS